MPSFCTNCATALETGANFCAACGTTAVPTSASTGPAGQPGGTPGYSNPQAVAEHSSYPVLRLIAVILKVLAATVVVVGILGSLFAIGQGYSGYGFLSGAIGAFVGAFVSALWGLTLWAWAELISVLVDIEHNTRIGARGV